MLCRSQVLLRVSPFALYLHEFSKSSSAKRTKGICAAAAKMYRKLSPAEKRALVQRAEVTTFPSQVAYRRMFKREMKHLQDMPLSKRHKHIKVKWASMKKSLTRTAPKTVPSAKRKVKRVSKTARKTAKGPRK
ncbi:kinetoplast-associated protein p18-2, putative [Leishmania panamensis]|uniref:Kinetoplast-associated protein p18-2, putative n=3 Tax=Leishmania guyanensis species complex TaxID=38579 RepID=A0A088RZB3_LEIPA|nr:kinetoplast-associated protein p18-2, putative [Leishmania panamensis]AIO01271.1 kinetoplast-associated protein p18-2, putative [Leishmania panamensis]CCM18436.1 kinetoplast-associated protein p18-2, putative [Leishmania guyanensis]